MFTIYWVAEVSTLYVIHVDCLALCFTNDVSFVVFLLHIRPLTQLIGPCLLPHHVSEKLRLRGVRNFVLAASTCSLQNFIVYKGERKRDAHTHTHTHKAKQMKHSGLGPSVQRHAVVQLVEALRYKLGSCGFDS